VTGDLADRAAELAALIPALAAALTRDNTPAGGRPVLSAGCVVNADVLHAALMLRREVPAACAEACALTGEPWHPRPLDTCLRALPRFRDRLASLEYVAAADRIESRVERWVRTVKLALGLRTPDVAFGAPCPLHEEPAPLIMVGSEGFVRDDMTIYWERAGLIRCPLCGAEWAKWQWDLLGEVLKASA
jgi:hypothetical protein